MEKTKKTELLQAESANLSTLLQPRFHIFELWYEVSAGGAFASVLSMPTLDNETHGAFRELEKAPRGAPKSGL